MTTPVVVPYGLVPFVTLPVGTCIRAMPRPTSPYVDIGTVVVPDELVNTQRLRTWTRDSLIGWGERVQSYLSVGGGKPPDDFWTPWTKVTLKGSYGNITYGSVDLAMETVLQSGGSAWHTSQTAPSTTWKGYRSGYQPNTNTTKTLKWSPGFSTLHGRFLTLPEGNAGAMLGEFGFELTDPLEQFTDSVTVWSKQVIYDGSVCWVGFNAATWYSLTEELEIV